MGFVDRSWGNRTGVVRAMSFCTDADYEEFFRPVPEFEEMFVRSGIPWSFALTGNRIELTGGPPVAKAEPGKTKEIPRCFQWLDWWRGLSPIG